MLEPLIPGDLSQGPEFVALRGELERRWSADTALWPERWTVDRPSIGQCAVTALLVFDRFGGEILRAVNEGAPHYWNRVDGLEVDLTRDQFDSWAPAEPIERIGRDDLEASGPTLAARYRQLVAEPDA